MADKPAMKLLAIESSTDTCLLALYDEASDQTYSKQVQGARSHSQNMLPFIEALLAEAGWSQYELTSVAFSAGPGSFTGVRLAASIAKTIAWTQDLPVLMPSSLAIVAQSYINEEQWQAGDTVCVVRDAKMQEAYVGFYQFNNGLLEICIDEALIPLSQLNNYLGESFESLKAQELHLLSDLSETIEAELGLTHSKCITPSVTGLIQQCKQLYSQNKVQSALSAEPVYLRGDSGWKTVTQQRQQQKTQ